MRGTGWSRSVKRAESQACVWAVDPLVHAWPPQVPPHVPLGPWRFMWLAASTVAGGQDTGPSVSPRLTKC